MFKTFAVSEIRPGMMVAKVLEQSGPVKIRKVGMIRSPDMIKGLIEMGVTSVEVDLSQSIDVESDNEQPIKTEPAITPTQRLVSSEQRVADVDRQLSQQFHRSLFLPAVDQMPSKWALYAKPYGKLLGAVVSGLCLGFAIVYLPTTWLKTAPNSMDVSQSSNESQQNLQTENTDQANSAAEPQSTLDNAMTSVVDVPSTVTTSAINNNEKATIDSQPADLLAESRTSQKAPNTPENSINVQSGQQVLGYQPSADQNNSRPQNNRPVNDTLNTSNEAETQALNADLLRRIQLAADEVDNQPAEPEPDALKITDLNAPPRIDQLRPVLLTQMPAMSFSAHMFASDPLDRWVRVNGKRLSEEDYITSDLQILEIQAEKVVLVFKGETFTMNALSDW